VDIHNSKERKTVLQWQLYWICTVIVTEGNRTFIVPAF